MRFSFEIPPLAVVKFQLSKCFILNLVIVTVGWVKRINPNPYLRQNYGWNIQTTLLAKYMKRNPTLFLWLIGTK